MPKLVPCQCDHEQADHTLDRVVTYPHLGQQIRCGCAICNCDGYRPDFEAVK